MRLAKIRTLVSGGESETLEFKKSTSQLTCPAETLCAFLNAAGGLVVIGMTLHGKIVGQEVSKLSKTLLTYFRSSSLQGLSR